MFWKTALPLSRVGFLSCPSPPSFMKSNVFKLDLCFALPSKNLVTQWSWKICSCLIYFAAHERNTPDHISLSLLTSERFPELATLYVICCQSALFISFVSGIESSGQRWLKNRSMVMSPNDWYIPSCRYKEQGNKQNCHMIVEVVTIVEGCIQTLVWWFTLAAMDKLNYCWKSMQLKQINSQPSEHIFAKKKPIEYELLLNKMHRFVSKVSKNWSLMQYELIWTHSSMCVQMAHFAQTSSSISCSTLALWCI